METSPHGMTPDRASNGDRARLQSSGNGNGESAELPVGGDPIGQGVQGSEVDSAGTEIKLIASAIEELQRRLERANEQLSHVAAVQTTEIEVGRLFAEAQRFSDASLSRLESEVQEVLSEAKAKAAEIIREATEEAQQIRVRAHNGSSVAGTAQELKTVIGAFASVNGELIKELKALNAMLTPLVDRGSTSIATERSTMGSV